MRVFGAPTSPSELVFWIGLEGPWGNEGRSLSEPAGFGIGSQERRFIPASGTVSRVRATIMAGERGGPRQAAVSQSDGAERSFVSPDMRVKLLPKSYILRCGLPLCRNLTK